MPATSTAQERLMQAAAHTPGGYDGVPQSIGKEYTDSDNTNEKSAGIAFIHNERVLLIKRSSEGTHPGEWCFPGGHLEIGESAREGALRECREEVGHSAEELLPFEENIGNFCLFFAKNNFVPVLNEESSGYAWCDIEALPSPMHSECAELIKTKGFKMALYMPRNELEVARRIQDGSMTSPQKFGNVWLFDIRITGTGTAYRSKGDEFVYRPPEHYMNNEFLARCNGLSVIWEHPERGTLNSEEYADRTIGSVFLPYLKEDIQEVWGIAKIYDEDAASSMIENNLSTSPTVVFTKQDGNATIKLEDGTNLLVEGCPSLLDHVAICAQGVWDKGGNPIGVVSDSVNSGVLNMDKEAEMKAKADAEEMKAKADAAEKDEFQKKFDAMMSAVDSLTKKVDALSSPTTAGTGTPEAVVADKKADGDMDMMADAEDEKEEKAKADAQAKADSAAIKARIDSVEQMLLRPVADADYEAMADAQARADSVASAFGQSASRPQVGETVLGYRKRLAAKFKSHSAQYKDIDISKIADDSLFAIVENAIYGDAISAANNPVLAVGEGLREVKTRSAAGHQISTFKGSISAWMDNFKADGYRVTQLNTGAK